MGHMPVGSGGGPREQPPEGVHGAYLHGIYYIGVHEKEWEGQISEKHQGLAVFELDAKDSSGYPFVLFKRVTWSAHEKSVVRSKWGPIFFPESFAWSDEQWGSRDLGPVADDLSDENMRGPCTVHVMHGRTGKGFVKSVAAVMPGRDPFVPERDYTHEVPFLVTMLRGQNPDKPALGLIRYSATEFGEPKPVYQGQRQTEDKELGERAKQDTPDGPDDPASFNPADFDDLEAGDAPPL